VCVASVVWFLGGVGAAAAVHVAEEYAWPGGFHAWLNRRRSVPVALAVAGNAAFLALALAGAIAGGVLGLAVAALVLANGIYHVGASLRARAYVPGTASAALLYVPFAAAAFVGAAR
jgi:hypothetical protein